MEGIETLQIRLYNPSSKAKAIAAYSDLDLAGKIEQLSESYLLEDTTLQGDLCIVLLWSRSKEDKEKSQLAIHLTALFSEYGSIHHSIWSNASPPDMAHALPREHAHHPTTDRASRHAP